MKVHYRVRSSDPLWPRAKKRSGTSLNNSITKVQNGSLYTYMVLISVQIGIMQGISAGLRVVSIMLDFLKVGESVEAMMLWRFWKKGFQVWMIQDLPTLI